MVCRGLFRQCPAGSVPYTIRSGDTLGKIARQYNTTVDNIMIFNPDIIPTNLRVGQNICVPLTIQVYPACSTTNYYVVRKGDKLESIASYFNISYQQLYYSNYGIDPNDLYEDQVLCIPVAPSPISIMADISQRRLILYKNSTIFRSYLIASENPNIRIPRGVFTVINKNLDPGEEQGARWLGLTEPEMGIHGTNAPEFINVQAQGRDIVMSNDDISELFNLVPVGTTVTVV